MSGTSYHLHDFVIWLGAYLCAVSLVAACGGVLVRFAGALLGPLGTYLQVAYRFFILHFGGALMAAGSLFFYVGIREDQRYVVFLGAFTVLFFFCAKLFMDVRRIHRSRLHDDFWLVVRLDPWLIPCTLVYSTSFFFMDPGFLGEHTAVALGLIRLALKQPFAEWVALGAGSFILVSFFSRIWADVLRREGGGLP